MSRGLHTLGSQCSLSVAYRLIGARVMSQEHIRNIAWFGRGALCMHSELPAGNHMLCEWLLCTMVHDCVKVLKLLMVRNTRAKLIGAPPSGSSWWVWSTGGCHHSRLVQEVDSGRFGDLQPCRSLNTGPCFSSRCRTEIAAFGTREILVENGAASLTSGAAPSGVNPCPHESIPSGLKGLSIRSDRPQLSQNGVGPVPSHKHALCSTQDFPENVAGVRLW